MTGYQILGATSAASTQEGGERAASALVSVPDEETARRRAVDTLRSLIGTPYVWASKDPAVGLDCSGAVTVAYEQAGLALPGARYRYDSADLHKILEETRNPKPGDLAFYGTGGKVSHVMMVSGEGKVVGATGGGPKTKTPDDARKIGAYVKERPTDYRKDLVSYGRVPRIPLGGQAGTRLQTSEARGERARMLGWGLLAAGLVATWIWRRLF